MEGDKEIDDDATSRNKVVIQTTSEIDNVDDGYKWKRYGSRPVKAYPKPRYFNLF